MLWYYRKYFSNSSYNSVSKSEYDFSIIHRRTFVWRAKYFHRYPLHNQYSPHNWFLDDRNFIIFVIKNWDLKISTTIKIHFQNFLHHPKMPWFWRFFDFSPETRDIFDSNDFLIYQRTWLEHFFEYC